MPHSTIILISFNWQFDQGLTKLLLSSVVWFGYLFDWKWWKMLIVGRLIATHWPTEKCWLLVSSLLRIGRRKNVDCWSAHCYALADGKMVQCCIKSQQLVLIIWDWKYYYRSWCHAIDRISFFISALRILKQGIRGLNLSEVWQRHCKYTRNHSPNARISKGGKSPKKSKKTLIKTVCKAGRIVGIVGLKPANGWSC